MEKKFSKENLISYLQTKDQEINQAAFGYVIRDIIKNNFPLFQISEVIQFSKHIPLEKKEEILLKIGSSIQKEQEISHFIEISYWHPNQLRLISHFLDIPIAYDIEEKLLEIIKNEKNTSKIPDVCYQTLLKKALPGHTECQKVLEDILDKNPSYLMADLIEIIQENQSLKALVLLERMLQNNHNGNNLFYLLQCIEKYIKKNEKNVVGQILLKIVIQYADTPELNRQTVDLILEQIKHLPDYINNSIQKEILKTLIFNIKETDFLAMEDIILAFSKFVREQRAYSYALEILKETFNQKKFKRANILWLSEFIILVEKNDFLFKEFMSVMNGFIICMGKNFDKSDMEYLKNVIQLCQKKSYLSKLLKEILEHCQETSFQIEMLLVYAETYAPYKQKILKSIDWHTCPISSTILYKLQLLYNKDRDEIYLDILNQLILRKTSDFCLLQQYGRLLSEFNLSEEELKKHTVLAKQIRMYQERQNLLESLNS